MRKLGKIFLLTVLVAVLPSFAFAAGDPPAARVIARGGDGRRVAGAE